MYKTINIPEEILEELKRLKSAGEIKSIGTFATEAIKSKLKKTRKNIVTKTDNKLIVKIEVSYE